MNHIRIVLCAVLSAAVFAAGARGEDGVDVRALQARLAEQEALLNALEAKAGSRGSANANYGGAPEALVSLNKNAVVTVGGTLNTRYYFNNGHISKGPIRVDYDGSLNHRVGGHPDRDRPYVFNAWNGEIEVNNTDVGGAGPFVNKARLGDLTISDAKLTVKIDVNEHFDAFLKIDLQSSDDASGSDNAEAYWVRWKNVANSGFGIKVGRDALTFGEAAPVGVLGSYAAGDGDGVADIPWRDRFKPSAVAGVPNSDSGYYARLAAPLHNNWDEGRYVQVTPYWESADGRLSAELSLYQDYGWHAQANSYRGGSDHDLGDNVYLSGHTWKGKNDGLGSASLRLRWRPVEGLLLSVSAANFHDRSSGARWGYVQGFRIEGNSRHYSAYDTDKRAGTKNNTAAGFAFEYRPAFFNCLNLWGQWIHGWNVDNIRDLDSDAANLGVSFDATDRLTFFAQGDYMRSKGYGRAFGTPSNWLYYAPSYGNDFDFSENPYAGYDKATAWASYIGARYALPFGASLEIGWKHEEITWKNGRAFQAYLPSHPANPLHYPAGYHKIKDTRLKGDTIYAHLGLDF